MIYEFETDPSRPFLKSKFPCTQINDLYTPILTELTVRNMKPYTTNPKGTRPISYLGLECAFKRIPAEPESKPDSPASSAVS